MLPITNAHGPLRPPPGPALLAHLVVGSTLAAADEVLGVGVQPLLQLAGEQRGFVYSGVIPDPMRGHDRHHDNHAWPAALLSGR